MEIFILTMRNIIKEDGEERRQSVHGSAVKYLEANYRNKAVLSSFCEKHHYNLQYISRSFKKETGMTALQYLQRIRIGRSCELLAGSELQENTGKWLQFCRQTDGNRHRIPLFLYYTNYSFR